jgi:hypothetical protein
VSPGLRAEAGSFRQFGEQQSPSDFPGAARQIAIAEVADAVQARMGPPLAGELPPAAPPTPARFDPLQVRAQMVREKVAMLQREMVNRQGADFDRSFMGHQVEAHLETLASLQATRRYASPELQRMLDQQAKTTQRRLDQARNLMEQLDRAVPSTAARREAPPTRR